MSLVTKKEKQHQQQKQEDSDSETEQTRRLNKTQPNIEKAVEDCSMNRTRSKRSNNGDGNNGQRKKSRREKIVAEDEQPDELQKAEVQEEPLAVDENEDDLELKIERVNCSMQISTKKKKVSNKESVKTKNRKNIPNNQQQGQKPKQKLKKFQTQKQLQQDIISESSQRSRDKKPKKLKKKLSTSEKGTRGQKQQKSARSPRSSAAKSSWSAQPPICRHSSVSSKLLFSLLVTIFYIIFLRAPPKITYPLAQYGQEIHENAFQIVTDKKTVTLRFPIEISEPIFSFLNIQSTKSARIKAKVNCTIGYKFESVATTATTQHIQMSALQILSVAIEDIALFNKEDGLFNSWEFYDHQKLLIFIKEKYFQELKKQALADVTEQSMQMYRTNAERLFRRIHEKYQGWLDWIIGRISKYVDFGLEPIVKEMELVYRSRGEIGNGAGQGEEQEEQDQL